MGFPYHTGMGHSFTVNIGDSSIGLTYCLRELLVLSLSDPDPHQSIRFPARIAF